MLLKYLILYFENNGIGSAKQQIRFFKKCKEKFRAKILKCLFNIFPFCKTCIFFFAVEF